MNLLEIAINTKEEALIAEEGGADRLEIAILSNRGGLTPTIEEIADVLSATTLPSYILFRPRLDTYEISDEDFAELLHYIGLLRMTPAKGITIGLIKDGQIDKEKINKIIEVKGDLEIAFNHAIDSTYNYEENIEWLVNNDGIDWIQTSGSSSTILDGYKRIIPLFEKVKSKLVLCRGINSDNIEKLIDAGFEGVVFQCRHGILNYEISDYSISLEKIQEFSRILRGKKIE